MKNAEETQRLETEKGVLKKLWATLFTSLPPLSSEQLYRWRDHSFQTKVFGIQKAAWKNEGLDGSMSLDHVLRFASIVMNQRTRLIRQKFADRLKELESSYLENVRPL